MEGGRDNSSLFMIVTEIIAIASVSCIAYVGMSYLIYSALCQYI